MRIGLERRASVVVLALLGAACGRGPNARSAEMGSFRAAGVSALPDPTVRGSRVLPETVDDSVVYGAEASGGLRAITAGLRVVTSSKGGIVAAEDRLPQAPQSTVALPDRLGGGFLFVIGNGVWRADRWLGPARPIFTSPQSVEALTAGLDRVYVRSQNAVLAIDGRSGQVLDLGPWPASPYVASYAAVDGWRAAAVTDMRGVVATFDAGATWRSLELPFESKQVAVSGDSIAIGGFESGRAETWYELRADGSLARLGSAPHDVKVKLTPSPPPRGLVIGSSVYPGGLVFPPAATATPVPPPPPVTSTTRTEEGEKEDSVTKIFGKRPLATAIEDGWPLSDGSAVVARDGSLARVRLADGVLTELVRDAFPLKPARCHPVSLTRPSAVGAFGFVCGEPRGTTAIYAFDPVRGRLSELRRFDRPRVVTSSGNGALAVRGPCAEDGEPPPPPRPTPAKLKEQDDEKAKDKAKGEQEPEAKESARPAKPSEKEGANEKATPTPTGEVRPYCVLGHDNAWREVHVRGDVDGERVVVLTDGRIVVVSPPQSLGSPARITVLDKGRATTVPIVFPRVTTDVARVLRLGLWLDGFEERKPGIVGGWIEAGGVMLGVEIGLDGKATPGQFVRDAGMPFVSGKYGLGWTGSRRGYETVDGGMTWNTIDLPDPLLPPNKVERRACGPIGCLARGWLRVGWGEAKAPPTPAAPPPYRSTASLSVPSVQLTCEPLAPLPPAATPAKSAASPTPSPSQPRIRVGSGFGGPPVLGSFNGLSELRPFYSQPAPALRESERGLDPDVRDLVERVPNIGSLARVYGWGPRTGEWDTLGRWQVKWLSPFAGWPDVRTSLPSAPPQVILDMTRMASGYGYGGASYGSNSTFQLTPADDAHHALLVARRTVRPEAILYELEADRAPVEVRRADGEPFGDIDSIVRAGGRWFVSTPAAAGSTSPTTIVWQVEGAVARELARVPRAFSDTGAAPNARTRLARRSDGRAIGLVADGQPTAERASSVRWVLPIDLESGALGEAEPLGYSDLAGRTLDACTDDVVGWVLDAPLGSAPVRLKLPQGGGGINNTYARLRLTPSRACIERLAGSYEGQTPERAAQLSRPGAASRATTSARPRGGELFVTAMSMQTRFPLKCSVTK